MLRLSGAELVEVPAGTLLEPEQLSHLERRLAEQLKKTEKNGIIWPNSGTIRQSPGPLYADRAGIWDESQQQSRRLDLRDRHRRHDRGRFERPAWENGGHCDQRRRPARRGNVSPVQGRQSDNYRRQLDRRGIGLAASPRHDGLQVDKSYLVPDEEALQLIFDVLQRESLHLGGSSGINIAGAIRLSIDFFPGKTIVPLYAAFVFAISSKLLDPDFRRSGKYPGCPTGSSANRTSGFEKT